MNIEHEKNKKYYEVRAKLTLAKFFPHIYSDRLVLFDKPDLIDDEKSQGIEVTRAFYEDAGEISGLTSKYLGNKIDEIPSKTLMHFKKLGAKPFIINNILYGMTQSAQWVTTICLKNCFVDKIKKINGNGYKKFNYNDLFIYSPGFDEYDLDEINTFMIEIKEVQKDFATKFRYVYVDDLYRIFQCDLENMSITNIEIPNDVAHNLCVLAKNEIPNA